jgi:hypothetical protein
MSDTDSPVTRRFSAVAAAHAGVAERDVPGVRDHGAGGRAHRAPSEIDFQDAGAVEPERLHGAEGLPGPPRPRRLVVN